MSSSSVAIPSRCPSARSASAAARPIVVQSMTNTDTADVEGTAQQVQSLARAGSELVRITVNTGEAAAAVAPHPRAARRSRGDACR